MEAKYLGTSVDKDEVLLGPVGSPNRIDQLLVLQGSLALDAG
jgi:hypothetical protein